MAILKISDLSVGDWVEIDHEDYGWKPAQLNVCGDIGVGAYFKDVDPDEEYDCTLCQLRPIPITAEVLEKNGFERSTSQFIVYHSDKVWISYDKPSETWSVTMYINDFTSNLHANILHIHQFQHALRLAGVDKEINL